MPYVRIWVHLIWATKNRENLISRELKPGLWAHIMKNASEKQIYLDQINGTGDHCHCLISLGATQSISKVAFLLKGESSKWVNASGLIGSHFDWQDEYLAGSVSESMVPRVRNYIKNQQEHHRKKSFREEYELFLKKYHFMTGG